jgi:hypothetical protein
MGLSAPVVLLLLLHMHMHIYKNITGHMHMISGVFFLGFMLSYGCFLCTRSFSRHPQSLTVADGVCLYAHTHAHTQSQRNGPPVRLEIKRGGVLKCLNHYKKKN